MRIGFGFDVHQLKKGHPFFLGGVKIEHDFGAFGHSDADVLLHAICDALLGAANLGDIGKHFSDKDPQWKNISSLLLLKKSFHLVKQAGWGIANIDCTLVLEAPKIQPYVEKMKTNIASCLGVNNTQISIKATTNETMGFVGRKEGVAAYAICLLTQD